MTEAVFQNADLAAIVQAIEDGKVEPGDKQKAALNDLADLLLDVSPADRVALVDRWGHVAAGPWRRTETAIRWDLLEEDRVICLVMTKRDALTRSPDLLLLLRQGRLHESGEVLQEVVAELRPDLRDGVLYAIRYDVGHLQWAFYYYHPSLPRVRDWDEVPVLRLHG